MSATVALAPARYKDRLKVMRAETVTAWMTGAISWLLAAFRAESATHIAALEEAESAPKRYYGAFYC